MRHLSGTVFTGSNSAELLVNGKSTFTAIFDAIDRACDYVLVELFIINNDQL
jgi:cardiolipin synthase